MSQDLEFIRLDVQGKLKHIEDNLLKQDPLLPVHLSQIHAVLIQYEELVHLLSDEEISTLVAGQQKQIGVHLHVEAITSKRGPKTVKRGESIAGDL